MPTAIIWGGRVVVAWLASSMLDSVAKTVDASADLTKQVQKAAPWVLAGIAVYAVMKGKR